MLSGTTRPPWWGQALALLSLVLLWLPPVLSIRSGDQRFGWHMYSSVVVYQLDYDRDVSDYFKAAKRFGLDLLPHKTNYYYYSIGGLRVVLATALRDLARRGLPSGCRIRWHYCGSRFKHDEYIAAFS